MFETTLCYPATPYLTDATLARFGLLSSQICNRYRFTAYATSEMDKELEALAAELDSIPGPSWRPHGLAQIPEGLGYIAVARHMGRIVGCVNVLYANFPDNEFCAFGLHADFGHSRCERGLKNFARDVAAYWAAYDPFVRLNLAGESHYTYAGAPVAYKRRALRCE